MTKVQDKIKKTLREAYPFPDEINQLANCLRQDLWYGPYPSGEDFDGFSYPGFSKGVDTLKDWVEEHIPSEVWYDNDCEVVMESQPEEGYFEEGENGEEEWFEYSMEEIWHVDREEILAYLFTSELAAYL